MTAPVIPLFKPNSRTPRDSGAAAELRPFTTVKYTHNDVARLRSAASPGAAEQLRERIARQNRADARFNATVVCLCLVGLVAAIVWVMT